MRVAIVLLGLALAPALAAQTYYKWKDASGATHYSETPPPKGRASAVKVRAGESVPAAEAAPAPAASTPAPTGDSPELQAAEAKYRKDACNAAQADVAAAQGTAMLVDGKDPTNAHRLTADERSAALVAAQARVQQFCEAGADKP